MMAVGSVVHWVEYSVALWAAKTVARKDASKVVMMVVLWVDRWVAY